MPSPTDFFLHCTYLPVLFHAFRMDFFYSRWSPACFTVILPPLLLLLLLLMQQTNELKVQALYMLHMSHKISPSIQRPVIVFFGYIKFFLVVATEKTFFFVLSCQQNEMYVSTVPCELCSWTNVQLPFISFNIGEIFSLSNISKTCLHDSNENALEMGNLKRNIKRNVILGTERWLQKCMHRKTWRKKINSGMNRITCEARIELTSVL